MVILFTSFPPDKRRGILSTQTLYLAALGKKSWYSEAGICNKIPILWVFADILQRILSELMEAENPSWNSGCPHFWNSIRNISIKAHRFYQILSRHMKNFLHSCYSLLFMPFIYMISLFQLTKYIGGCFNFSWCFWYVSTVISLLISPSITIFCVFSFSFFVP